MFIHLCICMRMHIYAYSYCTYIGGGWSPTFCR